MKKKRLDRDLWGFQGFPYYQMRLDCEIYHGLVSLIELVDGDYYYWELPKAGKIPVCGKGMTWLQLIPDNCSRLITTKYLPEAKAEQFKECPRSVSVWYVDVMDGFEYDPDGVAVYTDKYLDVIFTPQGDVKVDDRDELKEAFNSGELTQEQYDSAVAEGDLIIEELCSNIEETEMWCYKILCRMKEEIARGLKPIKQT